MNVARRAMLALGMAALAQGGCDSGIHHEHAKVHGTVTYRGKPVTFGQVLFMPLETPKEGLMQPASGTINPDGTYELASQADPGAILGEHRVLVIAVDGSSPAGSPASTKTIADAPAPSGTKAYQFKSAVPKRYSDPSASPLTRKVVRGDNTINIDLAD